MSIIYLEALLRNLDKGNLRLLTLAYFIIKEKVSLSDKLIKKISKESRENLLKQLSQIKFNEKCNLNNWEESVLEELSEAKSYQKIETRRKQTLWCLLVFVLLFFSVCVKIISIMNMPTLYSSIMSLFSLIGLGTVLHILSNYPNIYILRHLYIIKNLDIIEKNLEMIKLNEDSLKDKLLEQFKKNGYTILNEQQEKKSIKKYLENETSKLIDINTKINNVIDKSNDIKNINDYKFDLLSSLKIDEFEMQTLIIEKEYGCPTIFKKMNNILSIYYENYKNDEISCKNIEDLYNKTLSILIDILIKEKDYKTIGCILYQGYTTSDFKIYELIHNFTMKENLLGFVMSNLNKDIKEFIKNIPTMLEMGERLAKKSIYPDSLNKMLNQFRATIPLNIYNQMTVSLNGEENGK